MIDWKKDVGAKGRIEGRRPKPIGKPPMPTSPPPNDDFKKMLRKHLPEIFKELSEIGTTRISARAIRNF